MENVRESGRRSKGSILVKFWIKPGQTNSARRSFHVSLSRTHLNSGFREINLHRQVFSRENVRIVSLREGGLELLQLLEGESRPVSPLFPPHEGILADSVQCRVIGGVAGVCNTQKTRRDE